MGDDNGQRSTSGSGEEKPYMTTDDGQHRQRPGMGATDDGQYKKSGKFDVGNEPGGEEHGNY